MNSVETVEHIYEWLSAGNAPPILATFAPDIDFVSLKGILIAATMARGPDPMRSSGTSS